MNRLPDKVSAVTVKKTVDGTRKRKTRSDKGKSRDASVTELHTHITVDPRVMAAATRAMRPDERLVIVDAETVRLVPVQSTEGGRS